MKYINLLSKIKCLKSYDFFLLCNYRKFWGVSRCALQCTTMHSAHQVHTDLNNSLPPVLSCQLQKMLLRRNFAEMA